ncbi:hypothetical protein POM88_037394 [Heracleum sosnowskyi]|uniref:Cyclin N-terminal domain-containing protein n=1 Tax=Heracleum sosnowskyi TaxID=360622 RepID=A0AAD8HQ15_9APIA|nr:hypothetical protein POM88_037394 [Heracleum sosnowskyi]
MQLLVIACLSLAAKMEETEVPQCINLQVGESKFLFEAKTIQRMELLVCFKPSEIAAAVVLSVAGENQTVDTEKALYELDHHLQEDRVAKCVELMKKSSSLSSLSAIGLI